MVDKKTVAERRSRIPVRKRFAYVFRFALLAAMVMMAVWFVLNYDSLSIDMVRDLFKSGGKSGETSQTLSFTANSSNQVYKYREGLAVLSTAGFTVIVRTDYV